MLLQHLLQQGAAGGFAVLSLLQAVGKAAQHFRHGGIQHRVGVTDGLAAAQHAEFKLVAGKGKG